MLVSYDPMLEGSIEAQDLQILTRETAISDDS
jgi:hypothetical protein